MRQTLNGFWKLRIDPEENGLAEHWAAQPIVSAMEVQVPGCVQQLDCLAEDYPPCNDMRNSYLGTFFMEKTLELPALEAGQRCWLQLGGILPTCFIWINGQFLTKNIYCHTQIRQDITDLVAAGENRITVAVTEQYTSLIGGMRFEGANWAGLYSDSFVEITGAVRFSDAYVAFRDGRASFCAQVENTGEALSAEAELWLEDRKTVLPLQLAAGATVSLQIPVETEGLPRWSWRDPRLITVRIACRDGRGILCDHTFRTGLRELAVAGDRILVNGLPTFFAGAGSEYYSPTIAPLTDRQIIRDRYTRMQEYGFNFYRCHTHVPTEEELCVADEMGIMLVVEFGIISNFNIMQPLDKALEMLAVFIRQTRQHPSLFVYGLGNEGSQMMVEDPMEREKARIGYQLAKENTENQLVLIAFGMQGELPELDNDFETPHLWSDNFVWAYDGLTDIPWESVAEKTRGKPSIIHEYGKFCVWPSREEEAACIVPFGGKPDHGTQSHRWLAENGLAHLEDRMIANSRRMANTFNRIALESARRQPSNTGCILWSFYRNSWRNRGLCDDMGRMTSGNQDWFRKGANAEVALLMDRDYHNRAFPCEIRQTITLSLSDFGVRDLEGCVRATVCCGDAVLAEAAAQASIAVGETAPVLTLSFSVPAAFGGKKLGLHAVFLDGETLLAENSWDLWAFDTVCDQETMVFLHVENLTVYRALKRLFPRAQRLSSVDSVVIGCRSWEDPQLARTACGQRDVLIIADVYDPVIAECVQNQCKVLLLDSGFLPEQWMLPPLHKALGERDVGRFFTSFRAGWDKGNLVTIIDEDPILGKFPQDGCCDLQFFELMQSARIADLEQVTQVFDQKPTRIISSFSKMPPVPKKTTIFQDINAIKNQKNTEDRTFNAREQGYLLRLNPQTVLCTMKLTDNPAGQALLKEIVQNF